MPQRQASKALQLAGLIVALAAVFLSAKANMWWAAGLFVGLAAGLIVVVLRKRRRNSDSQNRPTSNSPALTLASEDPSAP
jgi:membrane protein implicated in regulation of membrane protease activity